MENIHDHFVKAAFSDTNRAIAFFEKFLPENLVVSLDLNSLQYLQESYLTDDLKARFSDMVFEVKAKDKNAQTADIVLLFEHKSSPDRHVLIQIGLYMFSHWWKCVREKKPLKPIIPILYYQGKRKWKVKTMLELFSKISGELPLFIPEIRHVFMALYALSDEEIASIRNKMMATAIMAQKNVFDPVILAKDLEKIFRLFPVKADDGNFLKTIFVYLFKVSEVPKTEWVKAIEIIPSAIKENLMTTYTWMKEEGRQEGIQEGIQKGLEEGKLESQTEIIMALYDDKIPVQSIAKYTKLTEEEVLQILRKHDKIKD